MLIEYIIGITIGVTLIYLLIGIGVARAEKQVRSYGDVDIMTVLFWPIAALTWAISGKI